MMEIGDATGMKMAKTLVPQNAELIMGQVSKKIRLIIGSKKKVLKRRGRGGG
jgi:hypothetical protein